MWWIAVRKCVNLADCVTRTIIFITFTLTQPLLKAIWIASKVHSEDFIRLFTTKFSRSHSNVWLDTKEFAQAWLNTMFLHHLTISYKQVDQRSATCDRFCRPKTGNSDEDNDFEANQIPVAQRTAFRVFLDDMLVRVLQLQLHHSQILYAVSWVLYQMVFRPPLAFLYLLFTIVNEFSWYMSTGVKIYLKETCNQAICKAEPKAKLSPVGGNWNETPSPIVSPVKSNSSNETCSGDLNCNQEKSDERRFWLSVSKRLQFTPISHIEIENFPMADQADLMPYHYNNKFCLEKYFREHLDEL